MLRAWLLRACLRAAVGRGLVWVRGRRRSCAAVSPGEVGGTREVCDATAQNLRCAALDDPADPHCRTVHPWRRVYVDGSMRQGQRQGATRAADSAQQCCASDEEAGCGVGRRNVRPTPRRALRKLLRGERNRHCRRGGNGLFGGWHRWLPRGHDQVQQHGRADCAAPCGGGGASASPRPGGDLRGQQVRSWARQRQVAGPEEEHGARQAAPGAGQRARPPARGAEIRDAEPRARARAHPGQRGGGPARKGSGTGRNRVK